MAGSFSDYAEDKILDHLVGKTSFTMPTHSWVGLSTVNPTDDASGNAEPAENYARIETAGSDWDASSGGAIANAAAITFATATGAGWGTITHFTLWDALTAGNMLAHGDLDVQKVVGTGDTFEFAIGALDITLA